MDGNYIKISRKMLEWEWYKNINTKVVFLHMLLKAYWKDTKVEGKVIPRGSFVSSIKNLSFETALTENEIRTAIKHLILTGEITSKGTNKNTVFTVNNYDLYQSINEQKNIPETNESQTINKPLTTYKEYKEIKEVNNNPPISPLRMFEQFWAAYPKSVMSAKHNTEFAYADAVKGGAGEEELLTAARNYAEACKVLGTDPQFIKNPDNFLRDNTFTGYLPGEYKKPEPKKGKAIDKYNQFMHSDYDMETLERELLRGDT